MRELGNPVMELQLIQVAAAVLPAIFLMRYIYLHDRNEKEPHWLLRKMIIGGIFAAFLSMLLEQVGLEYFLPSLPIRSETMYIIMTAVIVALVEEGTKMFFLHRSAWNDPNFDYLYDGVVYAVYVSLGFAALENILYVTQYGLNVAVLRALLAIPAHMAFAIYMGIFYGRAKYCEVRNNRSGKARMMFLAYLVPVILHAFYDATAMIGEGVATALFVGFVVIMYGVVYRRIQTEAREDKGIY